MSQGDDILRAVLELANYHDADAIQDLPGRGHALP